MSARSISMSVAGSRSVPVETVVGFPSLAKSVMVSVAG